MPPVAFLPPRLLLGSGSAIRRQLLEAAGISVTVSVPGIDEKGLGDRSDAEKLVHLLAEAKADVSSSRIFRNYFFQVPVWKLTYPTKASEKEIHLEKCQTVRDVRYVSSLEVDVSADDLSGLNCF